MQSIAENYWEKSTSANMTLSIQKKKPHHETRNGIGIHLNCSPANTKLTCPSNDFPSRLDDSHNQDRSSKRQHPTCPDYFRWIHEDLSPWRRTGVTQEMVERAKVKAEFRLVIVDGKVYVDTYSKSRYQRDIFTQWGVVQLLRRYPGKMPDLDIMFHMRDRPVIKKNLYPQPGGKAPPPLFGYDGNDDTFDIAFPDWSFWGWSRHGLKPWAALLKDFKKAEQSSKWVDREKHAYWKGSLLTRDRVDLAKCNVSGKQDWNARIYVAARSIGKAASKFVQEEMKMDYVYDYMFHLLKSYGDLFKYKPRIPPKAVQLCLESMACPTSGLKKKYLMESRIKGPSDSPPCSMPPPYDPRTHGSILRTKRNITKLVEAWEKQHWDTQKKHI
ncbi:hypothetical protein ACH5RR_019679 [Cinchona calisaya]|uniref:Glycosyl transferase CAP10 domain-containing protein n=1 Tax=Cinchona calisaya TaxID=153742 RepID=A0ABD2ZT48_9GENT